MQEGKKKGWCGRVRHLRNIAFVDHYLPPPNKKRHSFLTLINISVYLFDETPQCQPRATLRLSSLAAIRLASQSTCRPGQPSRPQPPLPRPPPPPPPPPSPLRRLRRRVVSGAASAHPVRVVLPSDHCVVVAPPVACSGLVSLAVDTMTSSDRGGGRRYCSNATRGFAIRIRGGSRQGDIKGEEARSSENICARRPACGQ